MWLYLAKVLNRVTTSIFLSAVGFCTVKPKMWLGLNYDWYQLHIKVT